MTNMATMPIYAKSLKKSSSPEPINRWPWNLVCSFVYASTTKIVQIMTLDWPWPILHQGQIWLHRLLCGRKWLFFCIQLNELVKLNEYQRSKSQFGTKVHMNTWGRMGMNMYTNELGRMTNMAAMPIYGKNLKKSSPPEPIDWWSWNLVRSIVYASTTLVVQIMTLG